MHAELEHTDALQIASSGELRMAQVFLSDGIWCQVVAFNCTALAQVLVITNVIIVNNFVITSVNTLLPWQRLIPQTWHTRDILNPP